MQKSNAKRLVYVFIFLLGIILAQVAVPVLRPYSNAVGKIDIGFLGIFIDGLWILFLILLWAFLFGINFILTSIIDKKIK